jgi:hypothetical protein
MLPSPLQEALVDIADLVLLLPVALGAIVLSATPGSRLKHFLVWIPLLAACMGITAFVKLTLMVCGSWDHGRPFSVSGGATMSAFVYGLLGLMLARSSPRPYVFFPVPLGILLVAAIAMTLVEVHYHSFQEVVIGAGWGAACACIGIALSGGRRLRKWMAIALLLPVVISFANGCIPGHPHVRDPSESRLRVWANFLRQHGWGDACPAFLASSDSRDAGNMNSPIRLPQ